MSLEKKEIKILDYTWGNLTLLLTGLGILYFGAAFLIKKNTEVILNRLNKEFAKNIKTAYCYMLGLAVAIVILLIILCKHFDLTSTLWGVSVIYTIVYFTAILELLIYYSIKLPKN